MKIHWLALFLILGLVPGYSAIAADTSPNFSELEIKQIAQNRELFRKCPTYSFNTLVPEERATQEMLEMNREANLAKRRAFILATMFAYAGTEDGRVDDDDLARLSPILTDKDLENKQQLLSLV